MSLTSKSLGMKRKVFWTVFMALRSGSGLKPAIVVGICRHNSDWTGQLVAGILQRLVLDQNHPSIGGRAN